MTKKLPRVLVVEDEPNIAELIAVNLRHQGFEPVLAADGVAAKRELDAILPDLVLLDWMLPGNQSGLMLARQWRAAPRTAQVPIIMLTAKSEETDKIAGLEGGADDYITKPFSPKELIARIRALLRRRAPEHLDEVVTIGFLRLDPANLRVFWRDQPRSLGPSEFRLLHFLMKSPERIHSRAQLLDKVWGDHVFIEERTVDVHIKRLRAALGEEAASLIETVRGVGYRFLGSGSGERAEEAGER